MEQAAKTPERTAVVFEGKEVTYRELDEMSNVLAHMLREKGVKRGDIVPIISKRSWHILVAMLGILKAGAGYMPIAPDYPKDRVQFIVKEAGNETGVLTVLQAGIVQEELELQTALVQEREKLIETIELLNKNLKVYDNLDGNKRTKETEALRMKIFRAKVIKVTELKSVDEQLNKVGAAIDSARRDALIEVTGLSHAGIKINIGRTHLITKETWKDVVYKSINEKIVVKSGDEK